MSISIHSLNVQIRVYTVRLGYIRKIHPKSLDAWSYSTYTPKYLLSLPSHKLHVESLNTGTYRFHVSHFVSHVSLLVFAQLNVLIRRQRLIKVRNRVKRNIMPRVNGQSVRMLENVTVHNIAGFYGVPIKRRGIPHNKIPHHIYLSFRLLLKRKRIRGQVRLKYFFPNVAISPSGRIKYLGNGRLLVLPGKGLKILLNVYVVEDQEKNKERLLMEVVS